MEECGFRSAECGIDVSRLRLSDHDHDCGTNDHRAAASLSLAGVRLALRPRAGAVLPAATARIWRGGPAAYLLGAVWSRIRAFLPLVRRRGASRLWRVFLSRRAGADPAVYGNFYHDQRDRGSPRG